MQDPDPNPYADPRPDDMERLDESENENENIRRLLAQFHAAEQDRLDRAKATLRDELLPVFLQHRVANIEAAYSGYGDSGCIDGTQYRDAAGQRVDRASIPGHMIERLETCLYEFLPAGFEVDSGSQGTLTIDTQTAKVTIRHQQNVTETRDSAREFEL